MDSNDYETGCQLLKLYLYGKNNDFGLFKENLSPAAKSNLERNFEGGAGGGKLSGWNPFSDYDFFTFTNSAFGYILDEMKPWNELNPKQKEYVLNICETLHNQNNLPHGLGAFTADSIMTRGIKDMAIALQYNTFLPFEKVGLKGKGSLPKVDINSWGHIKLWQGWDTIKSIGTGALCGGKGGPWGIAIGGIGGYVLGLSENLIYNDSPYTEKQGLAVIQKIKAQLKNPEKQNQKEKERTKENIKENIKEDNKENNKENSKEKKEKDTKEENKSSISEKPAKQIQTIIQTLPPKKQTNPNDVHQKAQDLAESMNNLRQVIHEETNKTNVPNDENKVLQQATAIQEKGSWFSRNWDWMAIIAAVLAATGLGALLLRKQKKKTKQAQNEVQNLENKVSSLNTQISNLKDTLKENQGNQSDNNINTDTNTDINTGTDTNMNPDVNTGSTTVLGSPLKEDKRYLKVVIKGNSSNEIS